MAGASAKRRLTAILAADVAGYSRLLAVDEAKTLAAVKTCINQILAPRVSGHGGRIVKTMGDGVLAEFDSALEALICAIEFQRAMAAHPWEDAPRLQFRVGVNAGDAIVENGDVFGDTVTVASRLEKLAEAGGVCVSARVREDALGRTDIAFDDVGEHRLKNIDRPIHVYRARLEPGERPTLALPDKPSIAVLPFENLSGDKAQDYFVDGVTEDIISALSRWRWFFVIARNSSFIYKGRAVDITQVGRELGVRYVLEGSVRRIGGRVRVAAQLIDAGAGAHLWTDTFDRDMPDIFALHDEITEHVVAAIEPAMLHSEGARAARKSAANLSAFDCFQRGMWHMNQMSAEAAHAARGLFEDAIRRDADLAIAHSALARVLYGGVVYGWSKDPELDLADAETVARKAIQLDPRDAWAHFALAGVLLSVGRHSEALDAARRTIALNPNFAFGHFRMGQILIYAGHAADAVAHIERSIRHNPFDPQIGAMRATLALAHFHAGDFETASAIAGEAARFDEARGATIQAASLARLGRLDEARAALAGDIPRRAALATRHPIPYARASDAQDLLDAFRLVGLAPSLPPRLDDEERPLATP